MCVYCFDPGQSPVAHGAFCTKPSSSVTSVAASSTRSGVHHDVRRPRRVAPRSAEQAGRPRGGRVAAAGWPGSGVARRRPRARRGASRHRHALILARRHVVTLPGGAEPLGVTVAGAAGRRGRCRRRQVVAAVGVDRRRSGRHRVGDGRSVVGRAVGDGLLGGLDGGVRAASRCDARARFWRDASDQLLVGASTGWPCPTATCP